MARFCGNCGAPLQDVGGFCGQCGTRAVPPQAEIFTSPAPQSSTGPASSVAPPGPVPDAASAPLTPPPVPPPATPPFSASGPASNNYAAGSPDGMPASPPLQDFQQVVAPTGKSTAAARKSNSGIIVFVIAAIVLVVVIVAAINNHKPNATYDRLINNAESPEEVAAKGSVALSQPIMLHITPDAYAQAQQLAAMNGIDPKQTYGAAYETRNFLPCDTPREPFTSMFGASIEGYGFEPDVIIGWLKRNKFVRIDQYAIQYPNAQYPGYGTENTYSCQVVTDDLVQYLSTGVRLDVE